MIHISWLEARNTIADLLVSIVRRRAYPNGPGERYARILDPQPEGYPHKTEHGAVTVTTTDAGTVYGDVMVYRGSPLPARQHSRPMASHGVGRPPEVNLARRINGREISGVWIDEKPPGPKNYAEWVEACGSQRKAAAALGISLGKLQRELRKAAA